MAISVEYFRQATSPNRASSIAAYGSGATGVIAAGTVGPSAVSVFLSYAGTPTSLAVSGVTTGLGIAQVFTDTQTASAAYAVVNPTTITASGSGAILAHFVGNAAGTNISITTPLDYLTAGTVTASGVYVLDYLGNLVNYNGSWTAVSAGAIPHSPPYRYLQAGDATHLYVLDNTTVEKLTLSTYATGTWSSMTAPMTGYLDFLTMNGTNPIVGGRQFMTYADVALDFHEFTNQIVAITSGNLKIYGWDSLNNLSLSQTLSASGTLVHCAPAINQLLTTDTTNGKVSVFVDTSGTWSGPSQTLAVSAAKGIGTSSDGSVALICSPTANLVSGLRAVGGTWSATSTAAVSGATAVALSSNVNAVVACASGVAVLSYVANWEVASVVSLPIAVTSICIDGVNSSVSYTCGTSGASGHVFAVQGGTYTEYSFAGSADAIAYSNGWILVLDISNSQVHIFTNETGFGITFNNTYSLSAATYKNLVPGLVDRIFISNSAGWGIYRLKYPFTLGKYYQSQIAQWNGSSWVMTDLGMPLLTAACSDGTYCYVTRYDNQLFKLNSAGVIQSGYPQTIPVFPGQSSNAALGFSDLIALGGDLYASSSLGGGVCQITGL